jgi:hypothetical protein
MDEVKFSKDKIIKILKIQKKRLVSKEKLLSDAHKEYLKACKIIEQRKKQIEFIKYKEKKVNEYISKVQMNHCYIIDSIHKVANVKYWIDYDLEMHEYYLSQERVELDSKETKYIESRQKWLQQKKKLEYIKDIFKKSKMHINMKRHDLEDSDIQEVIFLKQSNKYD